MVPAADAAFPPRAALTTVLAALAALAAAGLYELLLFAIPLIQTNFAITVGFALALARLTRWATRTGHARGRASAWVIALVIGVAGWLGSYAWGYRRALAGILDSLPEPHTWGELMAQFGLMDWLRLRLAHGWTLGAHSATGAEVIAVWLLELAILFFLGCFLPVQEAKKDAYCRRCARWMERRSRTIEAVTQALAAPRVEAGELRGLDALADPETAADHWLELVWWTCPGCGQQEASVTAVFSERLATGKRKHRRHVLAERIAPVARLDPPSEATGVVASPADPA